MSLSSGLAAWAGISICVKMVLHISETSIAQPQENFRNDALRFVLKMSGLRQIESTRGLLPNFNLRKDTAGFMLIPKYVELPHSTYSELNPNDFVLYQKAPGIIVKAETALVSRWMDFAVRVGVQGPGVKL